MSQNVNQSSQTSAINPCWYRIPVVWLMALVLLASVGGCLVNIGVAWQYADNSLQEVAPGGAFLLPARDDAHKP